MNNSPGGNRLVPSPYAIPSPIGHRAFSAFTPVSQPRHGRDMSPMVRTVYTVHVRVLCVVLVTIYSS